MAKKCCKTSPSFILGVITAVLLVIWYTRLEDRQKEFYKNLIRQLPDLPGRYMA